jgi:hypothetical protein
VARATTSTLNGREVIVAIVGGTLLTLALTRPHLKWVERLTEHSRTTRLWAERALTFFSFVMAGYAATAVALVLQKQQINPELGALLKGTAWFLVIYAWLVHLEPFSNEWSLRGGLAACALYSGAVIFAVTVGLAVASLVLTSSLDGVLGLLGMAAGTMVFGWALYRFGPGLMAALERGMGLKPEHSKTPEAPSRPENLYMKTIDTANVTVTSAPTRTPARSTRA